MKYEEESEELKTIREYGKSYFRGLIACAPQNLGIGNNLKIGIRYMDSSGNWTDMKEILSIDRSEL